MRSLSGKKTCLCALIFAAAVACPLFSESAEEWFSANKMAKPYAALRGELTELIDESASGGIPPDILLERIKEGASKRIASDRLLAAIRADSANYLYILSVYESRIPGILSPEEGRKKYLIRGGLILRAGISREVFSKADTSRDIDAMLSVAAVHTRSPLGDADAFALTRALSLSPEKEERFPSLSSLFLRGRSAGMSQKEIADLAVRALNGGGGFLQIENELSRRIK